jgi:hypothetical protein
MDLLRVPLAVAFLVACQGDDPPTSPHDTDTTPYTPPPTVPPPVPTTPGPTTPPGNVLSEVTSVLHGTYQTIVIVSWTQSADAAVHVDYSFDEGVWLSSPARDLAAGPHEELLLGVPYDVEVTWRVIAEDATAVVESEEHTIVTPPPPATIPEPLVAISEPTLQDPNTPYLYLSLVEANADFTDRWWALIIDRQARPVWASRSPQNRIHMHPRLSWNGDALLLDSNSYWGAFDGGDNSTVTKMKIDGTVLDFWETPGLHHPYTDMPDGTLAYSAYSTPQYLDDVIFLLHPDGSIESVFSCDDFLDDIGEPNNSDCGSNTLTYDPATDTFLVSLFFLETIVEFDATTGAYDKWFGHVDGSWAFDPPSSAFWYQHGGYYTADGTLLTSTHIEPRPDGGENVTREYMLDEVNKTLVNIWSFGEGDGVYGDQMGEAHRLPNGNVLQNYGTLARLREGTYDGTIAWDVLWPLSSDIGRSAPVSDLYALAPDRL